MTASRTLSLVFATLLLAACSTPKAALPTPQVSTTLETATPEAPVVTESAFPLTITDDLQNTITLEAPAQRLVSLGPAKTEILFAIGAGDQVVGRDASSDFPLQAEDVTNIGDLYALLNTDLIAGLEPDLVLASETTAPEQVAQLQQVGIPVYWMADPDDIEGLYGDINIVGQLTGHTDEAGALVAELQARLAEVQSRITGQAPVTAFYELDASDPATPYSAQPGSSIDLLANQAGGQLVAADSLDALVAQNPTVILLGDANYGVTVESVAQRPGWGSLAAVQNNRVYAFDNDLVDRPGPRWIDAIEQLAAFFYPDLFN